VEPVYIE